MAKPRRRAAAFINICTATAVPRPQPKRVEVYTGSTMAQSASIADPIAETDTPARFRGCLASLQRGCAKPRMIRRPGAQPRFLRLRVTGILAHNKPLL
jgi:hypothetical protein